MENNELEEMKAQLAVLNDKLEKESILNEKLTTKVLKSKTRIIDTNKNVSLILDILCLAFGPAIIQYARVQFGFPLWLGILAIAFTASDFIANLVLYMGINTKKLMNEDVVTSVTRLNKFKKSHKTMICIEWGIATMLIVFIIVWAWHILSMQGNILFIICSGITIIGAVWITKSAQKIVYSACDEIIEQLEERE